MGSISEPVAPLWAETQCVQSVTLSRAAGCNIFLKLENLQPSGSFKSRGIGNMMQRAASKIGPYRPLRFYIASGGNAGLACAHAALALSKPATVVVHLTTTDRMIEKLRGVGANVYQHGRNIYEADVFLREQLLENDEFGVYVHPFDHPDIWQGASTMVQELNMQIGEYDGIVCSVGGGGLLIGIIEGLARAQKRRPKHKKPVRVLAVETAGADSLSHALAAESLVALPEITSIATSLGCIKVAERAFELAQSKQVVSLVLSDAEAAMGSVRFADDERILVEAACGVSIAPVYNGQLRASLGRGMADEEWKAQRIVICVCGGSNVTLGLLAEYRQRYEKISGMGD